MEAANAADVLGEALYRAGLPRVRSADGLVLICIGTDRSIGDALGPLVGTYVTQSEPQGFTTLGTLDNPVHAGNLQETLEWVERRFRQPLVVAVDACLGRLESVGMVTVSPGSLRPGAGVNKSLPPVGDMHMTGIVNVGGFMEYFVLQNTRLSLVMRMAKVVAEAVRNGLDRLTRA